MISNEIGIGLSLGALGSASIWAITNSSVFTLRTFVDTAEKVDNTLRSMDLGLILSTVWSVGMGMLTKSFVVFIISLITAICFYFLFLFELSNVVVEKSIEI